MDDPRTLRSDASVVQVGLIDDNEDEADETLNEMRTRFNGHYRKADDVNRFDGRYIRMTEEEKATAIKSIKRALAAYGSALASSSILIPFFTKAKNDESLANAVDEYEEYAYYLLGLGPEHYPGYAPFPFLDMYESLAYLTSILEGKRGFFVFSLVTELGKKVKAKEALQKDFSLYSILNDKRFCKLVTELKEVFDIGYKEFSQNIPKINQPKQESSNNKHPYGCHEDWDMCYECIDKYEELHPKQEVKPPEAHKCVPFCDQVNKKHIGIHRAMSLEGRSVENYKVNTTARQAKNKVKKGAAKTKIQAKKVTRRQAHSLIGKKEL
jgi:hypothetical protein